MRTQLLIASIVTSLFLGLFAQAQKNEKYETKVDTVDGKVVKYVDVTPGAHDRIIESSEYSIAKLEKKHKLYVSDKKTQFKTMIERINNDLLDNKISEEQANTFKEKTAADLAEIITAHRAKTDAEIELIKKNRTSAFFDYSLEEDDSSTLEISTKKGIQLDINDEYRQNQQEIITTSGFTLGFGYNFMNGDELGINDFSFKNNNYSSIGYKFKTRLDDENRFRLTYGLEFQSQQTELNGNRVFTQGDNTQLAEIGFNVKFAKFRQDQFIFPVHLEIGGSDKKVYEDGRIRFTEYRKWKFGVGAFVGFNVSTRVKLKYELDGRDVKDVTIDNFDNQIFLYGLDTYVGRGNTVFFGRMNFNNVFKNNSIDAQYISFGIRIQD